MNIHEFLQGGNIEKTLAAHYINLHDWARLIYIPHFHMVTTWGWTMFHPETMAENVSFHARKGTLKPPGTAAAWGLNQKETSADWHKISLGKFGVVAVHKNVHRRTHGIQDYWLSYLSHRGKQNLQHADLRKLKHPCF